jgi:hypothetical protein
VSSSLSSAYKIFRRNQLYSTNTSCAAVECDFQELGVLEPTYTAVYVESLQELQYPCSELVDSTRRESERGRPEKWLKSVSKGSQTKCLFPKPRSPKKHDQIPKTHHPFIGSARKPKFCLALRRKSSSNQIQTCRIPRISI